jgi:hypothetical protein
VHDWNKSSSYLLQVKLSTCHLETFVHYYGLWDTYSTYASIFYLFVHTDDIEQISTALGRRLFFSSTNLIERIDANKNRRRSRRWDHWDMENGQERTTRNYIDKRYLYIVHKIEYKSCIELKDKTTVTSAL